jgi:tetratricopeptide (TPR) repeat protein
MKYFLRFIGFLFLFASCSGGVEKQAESVASPFMNDIDKYTFLINNEGKSAELLFKRSMAYASEKLFDKAIVDVEQALLLDSTNVDLWLHAAELYYTIRKVSEARNAIEKGLLISPDHLEANMRMGELQYYLGNYVMAIGYLDHALKINRYLAKAYFIKGMIFKENGDTNLAISSFQTTIEQDPEYFNAYMMLGNLFAEKNENIAINYYNNAIRVNPAMTEAHYALGYYLQEHGNAKGAIKVYDDLLSIDPNHVPTMHNLGYTFLFHLNSPSDAIPWFSKALTADSTFFLAAYHRGYAHELLGDKNNAASDYRWALQEYPEMELAEKGLKRLKK